MRFLLRALLGLALFAAGVGVAGYGAMTLKQSMEARQSGGGGRPGPSERIYSVSAGVIQLETAQPEIVSFGEIRSWRTLEIRAVIGGAIVELADVFRDGAAVEKSDLLFRIDPDDYIAAEADAKAALAEARADLAEAEASIGVAERELNAADTNRDLRANALARQEDLLRRGVSTSSVVEDAQMALASAEQSAASRAQSLLAAQSRIDRSRLKVERAEIALAEARRALVETEHRAPFSGLLTDVNAVLGGLATPNERLGQLIDPTALEAVFRLTNAQFARLLDRDGRLGQIPLRITLDLDDTPLTLTGVIDRVGAVVGEGETGRTVFAKLDIDEATLLRPGDFVTVTITEPPLQNVARIPAAAASEEGEILLIGPDDRLEAARVRILRRTGDDVIISEAPTGARYVAERAPQLGPGVKVKVIEKPASPGEAPVQPTGPQLVELAPELQKRLIEFVEGNNRMPADAKDRILARLKSGKAPQRMIDRITQRMGG